jgi:tRNA-2-methylthio-N6-dimethylallyladenosine synthase
MLAQLKTQGFDEAPSYKKADLVILNTCSIREKACHKAYSFLGRLKPLKERNGDFRIGFVGCAAQMQGVSLLEKYPYIDFIAGTYQISKIKELVEKSQVAAKPLVDTEFTRRDPFDFIPFSPLSKNSKIVEMVNIIHGCNNRCSYCIVPFVRGREVSRASGEIVDEIGRLSDHGTREVVLLGQNVNSYRSHEVGGTVTFVQLIEKIAAISGIERIRYVTSHPKDISLELIELYGTTPKLTSSLHLPVQSGSDKVLRAMCRNYTRQHYLNIAQKLRAIRPDIALTTDIIVGFPSETNEDLADTCTLLTEVKFDNIFSFKYSPRQGTKAFKFGDLIGEAEKDRRLKLVHQVQEQITRAYNERYLGEKTQVLVESVSKRNPAHFMGRTSTNRIVNFEGLPAHLGKLVEVEIAQVHAHSLWGVLCQSEKMLPGFVTSIIPDGVHHAY